MMSGLALLGLAAAWQAGRAPVHEYRSIVIEAPRTAAGFHNTNGYIAYKRAVDEGWEHLESQPMRAQDGEFLVVFLRRAK